MRAVRASKVVLSLTVPALLLLGSPSGRSADAGIPPVPSPEWVDAAGPATTRTAQDQAVVNPNGYTSARMCGTCHVDIYNSWRSSLHAFSLTDPIFDSSFMLALKDSGDEARRRCLHCHAPMTMFNGDYALKEGVTREGVSCDFCHTVTAVYLDGRAKPFQIDMSSTKRSVLKKAESPAHEVAYSELHSKAEFCGACHTYIAEGGAAIMSTYQEWRDGPYAAEGVQCQACHMIRSPGDVVAPEIKESAHNISLHSLIHDTDQLRSALTVSIEEADRKGEIVTMQVSVENVGSGHMVPTGIPTREVVLTVKAEAEGKEWTRERSFRKIVGDAEGNVLTTDHEILLHGRTILSDNRIRPREKRMERMVLRVPVSGLVKLTATITYRYAPSVLRVQQMNFELGRAERYIRLP